MVGLQVRAGGVWVFLPHQVCQGNRAQIVVDELVQLAPQRQGAAFGGALLIISLILLNNTIRLAIFSRRYLINTFKLVGATKGYIMRPFLGAAAKQGVWAGVTASLLFGGSIAALSGTMPEITASTQMVQIAVTVGGMILCGVVISLLFTAFAVNKFVNMKSNKIFLY